MKQWDVTIKRIGVVTVQDIIDKGERLAIPMSLEVLAAAKRAAPRRHPLGHFPNYSVEKHG
jgi:hypothetical protein